MGQNSEKWKEKYLNTVDELELLQNRSGEQQEILQRIIAKVSIAAQGQDEGLDEVLQQLRSLLHSNTGEKVQFESIIEELERQTVTLDDGRMRRNEQMLAALQNLIAQLRTIAPNRAIDKQLRLLAKKIEKQFDDINLRGPLLEDLANKQLQVLQQIKPDEVDKPGFIQRLFGRATRPHSDTTESTPDQEQAIDNEEHRERAELDSERATDVQFHISHEITPGFANISDQLVSVIKNLMGQIEVPELALVQATNVRQALSKPINWYELVPMLEDLSIVVLAALDQDHREFESFLKTLDQRLSEVQRFLGSAQQSQQDVISDGLRLDEVVRHQVSTLNDDIDVAVDLESLKQSVRNNLDAIVNSLDQFQLEQEKNEVSVVDQLAALVDKVASMEKESKDTKHSLEEQRKRLMLDSLTQLPNRESYENRLAQEYERWLRYHRPFSLAMCDVDLFKSVNDNYGHSSGDKVLRVIAKTLAKRLRKTDFVSRYGGEEFVILMPETSGEQAISTMNTVREAIAQCPFHFHEKRINVTMSFGVAEFSEGDDKKTVFERADKALYQAKDSGRNCCKLATKDEV